MSGYRKISSRLISSNKYWGYYLDDYSLPSGANAEYHYVSTPGSVFIIPVTDKGKFIMTRQYRYLNERESLEFPGGGMKKGLSPEENARRELLEETGIRAGEISMLAKFNPYNGVTNEICHLFLAKGLSFGAAANDETEQIEIIELDFSEINKLISGNEVWDGMTVAAWCYYRVMSGEEL